MSTRIFDARLFLMLFAVGCHAPSSIADEARVLCRPDGAAEFERVCVIERDGPLLTLSRPDGGFRRLLVTKDGRGVIAADGAEAAMVTISGNSEIEVALGGDAYRLPATLKGKPFAKTP